MAWFRDEESTSQMSSIIQAYREGSTSEEVIAELAGLRAVVAQLWLDVEPAQLQTLFLTPVGDITLGIIKAGFGKILLDQQDQVARKQLAARARDFNQPDAPGVLFAMLLFYPLDRVGFKSTNGLPEWFAEVLHSI